MKYKNVFLIWLWANVIICVTGFISCTLYFISKDGLKVDYLDLFSAEGMVMGIGLLVTIPSLIILMVFHHFYSIYKIEKTNYLSHYSLIIIIINFIYLVAFVIITDEMITWRSIIIILPTLLITIGAGLVSLYLDNKRRAKRINH